MNTVLMPGILRQQVELKDKQKQQYITRMAQVRSQVICFMLANLPKNRIPIELGGSLEANKLQLCTATEPTESEVTGGNIPLIKPNERKPRRWRTKADESTVESAEQQ